LRCSGLFPFSRRCHPLLSVLQNVVITLVRCQRTIKFRVRSFRGTPSAAKTHRYLSGFRLDCLPAQTRKEDKQSRTDEEKL
jgi:hypothetical protein